MSSQRLSRTRRKWRNEKEEKRERRTIFWINSSSSPIFLFIVSSLLICGVDGYPRANEPIEDEGDSLNITATTPPRKNAEEMGVPRCESNHDCVQNGVCRKDADGYGRCLCPGSCPPYVPTRCRLRHGDSECNDMDEGYNSRFFMPSPVCYREKCGCPPMFDSMTPPRQLNAPSDTKLLPVKCDRRELQVLSIAYPATTVFRGADLTVYCCLNMDPEGVVNSHGVEFVQNTTIVREATSTPFSETNRVVPPWCWVLRVMNVQLTDSGQYMCVVQQLGGRNAVRNAVDISVKAPRVITDFEVVPFATNASMSWKKMDNEPDLVVNLRLVRRTDKGGQEVWKQDNATSPVVIQDLRPAIPYTMYITVLDGLSEPVKFSQHFNTKDARPHPPKLEGIHLLNSPEVQGLVCDVEWKPPAVPNGRITKYYTRVQGSLRNIPPSLEVESDDGDTPASRVPDDFPTPIDPKCANFDNNENPDHSINPVDFLGDFFSCKYGPLKPNRNYSVSLWAENNASRSNALNVTGKCVTDYAEPNVVDIPSTYDGMNVTTFGLRFEKPPDETNGPITCYYMAVVPLLPNVSIDSLPPSAEIVVEKQNNAYANNLHENAAENKRYFAYIAESYTELPYETMIGDAMQAVDREKCSGMYKDRYVEEDGGLRTGLKYTGFLIVRVDKIGRTDSNDSSSGRSSRIERHLQPAGPAYGYSPYFKPVYLQVAGAGASTSTFFAIFFSIFFFIAIMGGVAAYMAHRRGLISSLCPLKKTAGGTVNNREMRSLLRHTYEPVPIDQLPTEFIMKHRDSDYLFTQEFEALPHFQLPATASLRNASRNRYKDIVAFDETRVKLNKIHGQDNSDYINANWIKSYDGRKHFIACQAPLEGKSPMDGTVGDFWRMIWEHDVRIIVMLSNLVERNRTQSARYWPDEGPITTADLKISPCGAEYLADHSIRTFDVIRTPCSMGNGCPRSSPEIVGSVSSEYANVPTSPSNGSIGGTVISLNSEDIDPENVRRIRHFHFIAWNDYKAPDCPTGLLRFLYKLRAQPEFLQYPVIVHCSAGVGRTGTLVALDSLIDQCREEQRADVFGFVAGMRKQRNMMVQNAEQYVFVYRALAEHHLFGMTDLSDKEFPSHYRRMQRLRGQTNPALLAEFERLSSTLEPLASHKFANENAGKNRFPSAIPFDKNRVILAPVIGHADTQYINASSMRGYFYPYILAQDPMGVETVFDFWRMLNDHDVTTIVMLTPEEEFAEDEKYWPTEIGVREIKQEFKSVSVRTLREESHGTYKLRQMTYCTSSEPSSHRTIWQFCMYGWRAGAARPPSTEHLISLIGAVLERHSSQAETGPIVVHCRNGSSEAGVFCAVSLLVERWKAEKRVDVFQTVHGIQSQRAQTFTRVEEYEFCYDAISECLKVPPHR